MSVLCCTIPTLRADNTRWGEQLSHSLVCSQKRFVFFWYLWKKHRLETHRWSSFRQKRCLILHTHRRVMLVSGMGRTLAMVVASNTWFWGYRSPAVMPNDLEALQRAAQTHRRQPRLPQNKQLGSAGVKCSISWLKRHPFTISLNLCDPYAKYWWFPCIFWGLFCSFLLLLNRDHSAPCPQMSPTYAPLKAKVTGAVPHSINRKPSHLRSPVNSEACFDLVLEAFKAANKSRPPRPGSHHTSHSFRVNSAVI